MSKNGGFFFQRFHGGSPNDNVKILLELTHMISLATSLKKSFLEIQKRRGIERVKDVDTYDKMAEGIIKLIPQVVR